MPTTGDRSLTPQSARLGELISLQACVSAPDLTLDEVRPYIDDRIENLLPLDYKDYRQRWHALPAGAEPGSLLRFHEWRWLVAELEELHVQAETRDEQPAGDRWMELRQVLLVSP